MSDESGMVDIVTRLRRYAEPESSIRVKDVLDLAALDAANEIVALRSRLEKAEAERDAAKALADDNQRGWFLDEAIQIRNDALEEAEHSLDAACAATGGHFVVARDMIRALRSQS